ncbi:MAG: hypothetical protein WEB31_06225 [Chthoniobacterales bacterium]
MKALLLTFVLLVAALTPVRAQGKDCGCQAKCSPTCQCKHEEKTKAP